MFNFLSPTGFDLQIEKIPSVCRTIQNIYIPGMSLGSADVPTPFTRVPLAGNIGYEDFAIEFKVLEDLENYIEIVNWMTELGKTKSYDQYNNKKYDALITTLSSSKRKVKVIKLTDVFPTSIQPLNFDTRVTDIQYLTCQATFKYTTMEFI